MGKVFRKILKWLVYAGAVCVMLLALLVGLARLFLPHVPEYHDDIRRWAAEATGFDVQFLSISASWPFSGPELQFIDVTVLSPDTGEKIFVADHLTVGISPLDLIRNRRVLLSHLGVEGSNIRVRRDADRKLMVQDRPLDEFIQFETGPDEPLSLPDLSIELSDIEVTFVDVSRSSDEYEFAIEQLDIGLSDDLIRIGGEVKLAPEFGGQATISTDIPTRLLQPDKEPVENVNRRSVGRASREWRFFLDIDDLHTGRLLTYLLNREIPISGADGAVTISASISDNKPQSISVDLDVEDVTLRIDENRTEQREELSGRFEWTREGNEGWLLAGTGISVKRGDLFAPHSDFTIAVQPAINGREKSIRAGSEFLDLQDLYPFVQVAAGEGLLEGIVPGNLQLPGAVQGEVRKFSLSMQSASDAPVVFDIDGRFTDISLVNFGNGNSIYRFSGGLVANQDKGSLQIDCTSSEVEWPALFNAPVEFQNLLGVVDWQVDKDAVHVSSNDMLFRTTFLETNTRFILDWPLNEDSPRLDLTTTGYADNVSQIVNLLPLKKFPKRVSGWLGRAIVAGHIPRAELRFNGLLREFPFETGEGLFKADIDVQDAVLDYASKWPRAENVDAHLVFDGMSLTTQQNDGRIGLIGFRDVDVRIADLRKGLLEIRTRQPVAVDAALNFIRRSRVAAAIGPIIDKATGEGTVDADFKLVVPIKNPADYDLDIRAVANGVNLGLTGIDWGLSELGGAFRIQNTRFYSDGMTGSLLGEPITLAMRPASESSDLYNQFIRIEGRTPIEGWVHALSLPFAERIDGPANWTALVLIPQRRDAVRPPVHVIARTDLVGVESRLPDPLAKPPEAVRSLEVDVAFPAEGRLEVSGRLHPKLNWAFELESGEQPWHITRGAVHAGSAAAILPIDTGVEVSGHLAFLRFDDWLALMDQPTGNEAGTGPVTEKSGHADWQETWRDAVLRIDRLSAFGQLFSGVQIEAQQDERNWQVQIEAPAIAGRMTVPLDLDSGHPVAMDMDRLWLVDKDTDDPYAGESADPREIPSIDVKVDDFVINNMHFGSLDTTLSNVAGGIVAQPILMQGSTFTIKGQGAWLVHPNNDELRQTRLALSLEGTDIKAVLTALGYIPVIEGKKISASGELNWLGGPSGDFLERADGDFKIHMKNGSLLDVDPGGGRILGILSIAAVPRRLLLDFSDVFDEGLGFDTIKGDFTVDDGNAYTCNLGMEGSVADMGVVGRAGFGARDYDQLAVVRPHVSNLFAVGGTVVGGPVVGAAMLLFSQIFHKPLSTLGESYYRVKGSWDDPVVEQIHGDDLDVAPLRNCEKYLSEAITESLKE